MSQTESWEFEDFLVRLRRNDDEAIRTFVSKYEPFIRRTLRFRIARASLQAAADSVDVCNSVMGGFLLRLAAGEYSLTSEEDLRRLLISIANKKFLVLNRREKAAKRDHRQTLSLEDVREQPARETGVSQIECQDVIKVVMQRLTPEEKILLSLRQEGLAWDAIAERVSESPVLIRKRLSKALNRVAVELNIENAE